MDRRHFFASGLFVLTPSLILAPDLVLANDLDKVLAAVKASQAKKLNQSDAQLGLKEALSLGAVASVTRLSKPDGYWADKVVQIALPKSLRKVQQTLKPLGMSGALDEVHENMNHAAEQAAPVAKDLFLDAIKSMTITDAISIVRGGPTSGTQYLQKATTPRLTTLFTPPMTKALENTGAVKALESAVKRNGLGSYLKQDPKTYLGNYAVTQALSGLFHYVGSEESAIRTDKNKRNSAILKAVFG